MTGTRYLVADVFDGLAALRSEGTQVDLVLSSPPFLALRSYLPADHPDKGKEIGSEPTPAAFLSTMLDVVEACAEVLAPHGTLAFEFGDTYSGSGGAGGDYADNGLRGGQGKFAGSASSMRESNAAHWRMKNAERDAWPMDKSLCMIPELFAASLAYGRNLLDPERTTDPWRIRNTIAWVRPNPPVGALGDKFRPAKSLITVAAKARDRWFDLDAVRTEFAAGNNGGGGGAATKGGKTEPGQRLPERKMTQAGAPPLDWWKISPGGYSGSHYAVWPPELLHRPIEAMCPRRVCRTCGTPSRREVVTHNAAGTALYRPPTKDGDLRRTMIADKRDHSYETTGWTTCGCPGTDGIRLDGYHTGPGWRPGIVLDPFGGSGTTAMVANGLSRDAICIDLDARNAELAYERIGMFLQVEHISTAGAA